MRPRIDINVNMFVDLFDELFGNETMRPSRLSIVHCEFFTSFHVLLVLVNSRPAICDSLTELGQSSTSATYSRFPEACLKRQNSCALKYFGVIWSCKQFSSSFS